ncbi:MAG: glycosyltransferase family 4 protein [Candidatus Paceibacterota bacterium]|jgi:glycosyltransferase involved in cell wall biosynthesis
MRLVIATPLYPPEIGGPATYAKLLFEGLPGKGVSVELVKFSDVRHLPKIVRHYVYYRRVLKAARRADVVLALDPVSVGLPAQKAAEKAGKPFVVKIVGDYAWEQGQQRFGVTQTLDEFVQEKKVSLPLRVLRQIQTRVALAAAKVLVPSGYLKNVVTEWGVPSDAIQVVYNAVSPEEPGTVPSAVMGLPRPVVVTVGRLVPWKGMSGVIDSVAGLSDEGGKASLVIVGDGPDHVPLISHAEKALEGRCIFTGALPHADTLATMKYADVLVLNSSYEGLSHILIEALMLGVPVVATEVGGNTEVIQDGENGLLVPFGDTAALSGALARILKEGKLRSHISARALESAKRFEVETMLRETANLLKV